MKNILPLFICALLVSTLYGQQCTNNPSIQAGNINPAPLVWGEDGTLSFTYLENLLDYTDEETDPTQLTICMLNIEPVNGIASIGGGFYMNFDWLYDPVSNCYQGTQNSDILGGTGGTITVDFKQTNFFLCADNQMGFNANIQPATCMNGINQTADDNESVYTCVLPILPLDLVSFTGQENNCRIQLNWETSNEVDVSHFEVQESKDGINFNQIGRIDANGGPDYSFTDDQIQAINYYRLKIVDTDASIEYTEILTVTTTCMDDLSVIDIFPNPNKSGLLHLHFISNKLDYEPGKVVITDVLSRRLIEIPITVKLGMNQLIIDVKELPSAPYFIAIEGNGWISSFHKFVTIAK